MVLNLHANRLSEKINTDQVFIELSTQKFRLGGIRLLSNIEDESDDRFVAVSLYSARARVVFQLNEEIERNKKQPEMISMSRGKGIVASKRIIDISLPDL